MDLLTTTPWLRFAAFVALFVIWLFKSIERGDTFWTLSRRALPVILCLVGVEVAGYRIAWPASIPLELPWGLWGMFAGILLREIVSCARHGGGDKGLGLFVVGFELAVLMVFGGVLYFLQRIGSVAGLLRATLAMGSLLALLGGSVTYEFGRDWKRKRRASSVKCC